MAQKIELRKQNDWPAEKKYKLIELYEQHELLWKKSHPDYSVAQKRNDAQNAIGKEFGVFGLEIKARWTSLRQSFFRELKKKREAKSGSARAKEPVWKYFSSMQFLRSEATEPGQTYSGASTSESLELYTDSESIASTSASTSSFVTKKRKRTDEPEKFKQKAIFNRFLSELERKDDELEEFFGSISYAMRTVRKKDRKSYRKLKFNIEDLVFGALKMTRSIASDDENENGTSAKTQALNAVHSVMPDTFVIFKEEYLEDCI